MYKQLRLFKEDKAKADIKQRRKAIQIIKDIIENLKALEDLEGVREDIKYFRDLLAKLEKRDV